MNDSAMARRYYLHVKHGVTLTVHDLERIVEAIERKAQRIAELEAQLSEREERERLTVEYTEAHEEYRTTALGDIKDMGRKFRSEIAWRKHVWRKHKEERNG